jgi:hypothetical protein
MKKLLAMLIALALVFTALTVLVSAEGEDEPDSYFWFNLETLPSNNQADVVFKIPGEIIADGDVTFSAYVYFDENITGAGFGYVNMYSYASEENHRDFTYLIKFQDFAQSTAANRGHWTEITYTANPYDASYNGANCGSVGGKATPEFIAIGVGFYNATGLVKVARLSASQNGEVIWSLDFADGPKLEEGSPLLPATAPLLSCTFEDEGTIWGVEAPNAVIEVSDEPAEPLPENLENIAEGKSYTVEGNNPRGDGYDDNETGKLTNGEAIESEATQENLGFQAIDGTVTVVIDLGEVKDFVAMTADTLYGAWGIAAPTGVSFAVSEDGENFSDPVAGKLTETAGSGDWVIQLYTAQGEFTGRYVKVIYTREGAGHLWVSEIEVLAEAAAPVEESSEPAPAESEPATPTTGDAGIIALAVISVIALGGAVVVKKVK